MVANGFFKYLHFIYARYEQFTTHSQCQGHTNTNKIKQELLTQIMNIYNRKKQELHSESLKV